MNRCRITVLKRTYFEELSQTYAPFISAPCEILKEGDIFYTGGPFGDDIPEGFCHHAWDAIQKQAAILACGGQLYGSNQQIACCNDGVRPVFFKLEAVSEPD